FAAAIVALAPLACESTPPPAAPTPPAPVVTTPAGQQLPPAPEPPDVVGTIRWKNPGATLENLGGCANVPSQLVTGGARALLEIGMHDALRGQADGKKLAALVALDAPVDAMVALDPTSKRGKPMSAFSIGLTSFERAKEAIESVAPLTEAAPGVFRIGDKPRSLTCVLANAGGSTPARLVCGGRDKDVVALAPYLARTAPAQPSPPQDLHAELRWGAIDARFGQEMRQGLRGLPLVAGAIKLNDKRFDDAVDEAANALAGELSAEIGDLDKVTLDLATDPAACVSFGGGLQLRGHASWLAQTMIDRPERQGPAPAIFWRLPKDADSAFYGHGADPARFADVMRVGRALLQGWMEHGKVAPADAKAVADLLAPVLPKDVNSVSASGHIDVPKLRNLKPQQVQDAMMRSYLGWYVLGMDDGGDAVAKWLREAVAAYNRPGVQKNLKIQLKDEAKHVPVLRLGQGPAQLGRGALDLEIRVNDLAPPDLAPGPKKPDKVSFVGHLLLMMDGKGAWLGFGADRDEVVKHMLATKAGAPEAGTLAARPGLEPLKTGKYLSAGFVTIVPFTKALGTGVGIYADASGLGGPMVTDVLNTLNDLPNKGQTPMFLTSTISGGDHARVDLAFRVQKGTAQDLGAIAMTALRIVTAVRGGGPVMPPPPAKP
ncbi:MAG TPA: hypothetical protein VHB21_00565, partial [Minicystis sp.]|nr:hypothetical protein [Minicystis sp.]